MSQKVRVFVQDDIEKVSEIFEGIPDGWSQNALKDGLNNESIKSFVLEDDNNIVAFSAYLVSDDAELCFIVTDKTQQRKGYGEFLLKETLSNINLDCVLEVRESNFSAINLYEKLGFKLLGKRNNFYQNPRENALIYKKDI